MLLYDNPESGNCYKVRLVLGHTGRACERHTVDVVDKTGRDDLLGGKSPSLRVPTLVLDDGRALAESNAIAWYLAQGTPLVPTDRFVHAQMLQWMFFEQYEHEPSIAVARHIHHMLGNPADAADTLAVATAKGTAVLGVMERHLAEHAYVAGDALSVADLVLYANTHIAPQGRFDLGAFPAVSAWLERVAAQPGHVEILA